MQCFAMFMFVGFHLLDTSGRLQEVVAVAKVQQMLKMKFLQRHEA